MSSDEELPPETIEMIGELFADFFGDADVNRVTLAVSDAEAAAGVTREVTVRRRVCCTTCDGRGGATEHADACGACAGKGQLVQQHGAMTHSTMCPACQGIGRIARDPCAACRGSGTQVTPGTIEIIVPAGTSHGEILRIPGAGALDRGGQPAPIAVYVLVGDRPDPRAIATEEQGAMLEGMLQEVGFGAGQVQPSVPMARIHQPRPAKFWLATLGLVMLALLAVAMWRVLRA